MAKKTPFKTAEQKQLAANRAKRYRLNKKNTRLDPEYFPPSQSRQPTVYRSTSDDTDHQAPRSTDEEDDQQQTRNRSMQIATANLQYAPGRIDEEDDQHQTRNRPFQSASSFTDQVMSPDHATATPIQHIDFPMLEDVPNDSDSGSEDMQQYRGPTAFEHDDPLDVYSNMLAQFKQLGLSRKSVQKLYDMTNANAESIAMLKNGGRLPTQARTLTNKAMAAAPPVTMTYWTLKKPATRTKPRQLERGTGSTIPANILQKSGKLIRAVASVKLRDIITFHDVKHPHCDSSVPKEMYLSSDGVQPSESGSHRMDIISVAFSGCGTSYPLQVWRYQGERPKRNLKKDKKLKYTKNKPSLQLYYKYAVEQAIEAHKQGLVAVKALIADGKERKFIKVCVITLCYIGFPFSSHVSF